MNKKKFHDKHVLLSLLLTVLLIIGSLTATQTFAAANDISEDIKITNVSVNTGGNTIKQTGHTFSDGFHSVLFEWETDLELINAGDFFTLDFSFAGVGNLSTGAAANVIYNGAAVGTISWSAVDTSTPGKKIATVTVAFDTEINNVGISGKGEFGYTYSRAAEDVDKDTSLIISYSEGTGTHTIEFTGKHSPTAVDGPSTSNNPYTAPRAFKGSLVDLSVGADKNHYASWTVILNPAAKLIDDYHTGLTGTDTLVLRDEFDISSQNMMQLVPLQYMYYKWETDADGAGRSHHTRVEPYTIGTTTEGGFFGTDSTVYVKMYKISREKLTEITSGPVFDPISPHKRPDEDQTTYRILSHLQRASLYASADSGDISFSTPYAYQAFMDEAIPLNQDEITSFKVLPGDGGFEIEFEAGLLDEYVVMMSYNTLLLEPGVAGINYKNGVKLSKKSNSSSVTSTDGYIMRSWASGSVTSVNGGIMVTKVNEGKSYLGEAANGTKFTVTRRKIGTGAPLVTGEGLSSWDLTIVSNSQVASPNLNPISEVYYELVETAAPTGYQKLSKPIYFTMKNVSGKFEVELGTVDPVTFIFTANDTVYDGIALMGTDTNDIRVINIPGTVPTPTPTPTPAPVSTPEPDPDPTPSPTATATPTPTPEPEDEDDTDEETPTPTPAPTPTPVDEDNTTDEEIATPAPTATPDPRESYTFELQDDGMYLVFDEFGTPLGYVRTPDLEGLDDMIPLGTFRPNPQTGDSFMPAVYTGGLLVSLAALYIIGRIWTRSRKQDS